VRGRKWTWQRGEKGMVGRAVVERKGKEGRKCKYPNLLLNNLTTVRI